MSLISVTRVFSLILTLSYRRPLMTSHDVFLSLPKMYSYLSPWIDFFFSFPIPGCSGSFPVFDAFPSAGYLLLYRQDKEEEYWQDSCLFYYSCYCFPSRLKHDGGFPCILPYPKYFSWISTLESMKKQAFQWLEILLGADPRDLVLLYQPIFILAFRNLLKTLAKFFLQTFIASGVYLRETSFCILSFLEGTNLLKFSSMYVCVTKYISNKFPQVDIVKTISSHHNAEKRANRNY